MKPILKYLSHSKKGLRREKNQDRILIIDNDQYYLFCVFDGVSSLSTSHLFISHYTKKLKTRLSLFQPNEKNLGQLLFETHSDVLSGGSKGMSTVSLLFYHKIQNSAHFVNIGDSRIYIFTNQFIEKVTQDDHLTDSPNVLTKCLGTKELDIDDFTPRKIINEYNFLICTDGFYNLMASNLKTYFETYNFKNFKNIEKKLSLLQRNKNNDDSSYILIKNEVSSGS